MEWLMEEEMEERAWAVGDFPAQFSASIADHGG